MAIVLPGGEGLLLDLFFPAGHSWLVSALWDDTWIDIGDTAAVFRGVVETARLIAGWARAMQAERRGIAFPAPYGP